MSSQPYLLIFRCCSPDRYLSLSSEQRQQLLEKWNAWYAWLATDRKVVEGRPLEPEGRLVYGPDGEGVIDGPYVEAKEIVAGYFLLSVADLDEATAIARQCPSLAHGMIVEIRPAGECCHSQRGDETASPVSEVAHHA